MPNYLSLMSQSSPCFVPGHYTYTTDSQVTQKGLVDLNSDSRSLSLKFIVL